MKDQAVRHRRAAVRSSLALLSFTAFVLAAASSVQAATTQVTVEGPETAPPEATHWWLEAGGAAGALLVQGEDPTPLGLRLGAGRVFGSNDRYYARALLGATNGGLGDSAFAFEYGASLGFQARPWLQLGGTVGHRITSERALQPWFEQSWYLGGEVAERLFSWETVSVWALQSIAPFGLRTARAELLDGVLVNVDDRTDFAVRLELGIMIRGVQ